MNHFQTHDPHEEIDPRIVELLEPLRSYPERNPRAVAAGRARFLEQLDALDLPRTQSSRDDRLLYRLFHPHRKSEETPMNAPRFAFSVFTVAAFLLIVLFGGAGTTVYASQSALPGDALYPVKTTFEHTQASLTADAVRRAELYLEFASNRLDEIERLIEQGRFEGIQTATGDFERYVGLAMREMDTVSAGDPARAAELSRKVFQAMTRYNHALAGMVDRIPETARQHVRHAIGVSDPASYANETEFSGVVEAIGGTSWTVSGTAVSITPQTVIQGSIRIGDAVKVRAYTAADGSLVAREIEREMQGEYGPGAHGTAAPNPSHTPFPTGTRTPQEDGQRHGEPGGTHTPDAGDQDRDRLRTHTPEPVHDGEQDGDGSHDRSGSGGQNDPGGDDTGEQQNGSGDGGDDTGGKGEGTGDGEHDSSGGEHDGGGDGSGGGGHN